VPHLQVHELIVYAVRIKISSAAVRVDHAAPLQLNQCPVSRG
jgi:hypothetical protein